MAEIKVPTLGESVTEATVGRWFKQPGEAVAADEPLVELETDKVTLAAPARAAGVLGDISAEQGEAVAVGAILGSIKEGAGAAPKSVASGTGTGKPDTKTTSTMPINAADEEPKPRSATDKKETTDKKDVAAGSPAASSTTMPPPPSAWST